MQFWRVSVLQRHGVLLPGGDFFHGVFPSEDQQQQQKFLQQQAEKVARIHSSSKREKKQPKASFHHHFLWVSEVTLGIFEVQFWGFSVLQRHGVLLQSNGFFFPGSAAGAAALKSGQGPPGRVLAERQFSPLRRRDGPPPLPETPLPAKKSRVLRCFVLFAFFPIFRIWWFKMGQHGPR